MKKSHREYLTKKFLSSGLSPDQEHAYNQGASDMYDLMRHGDQDICTCTMSSYYHAGRSNYCTKCEKIVL